MFRWLSLVILVSLFLMMFFGCGGNQMEKQFKQFLTAHVEKVQPLAKEMNLAYWNASITGNSEDFKKYANLELELRTIYSDTSEFAQLKHFKESNQINQAQLKRQLELLYNFFLSNQIDPQLLKQIVEKSSAVTEKFNTYRGTIDGKKVTDNDIRKILKQETDSSIRRDTWLASKQVGKEVANDLIELVKLRNEAANKLGFENYYLMSLALAEQNINDLNEIFDELSELTNQPFKQLKAELDSILAYNYGLAVAGLMPWHYHDPFFQEGPLVYEVDLDKYFQDKDIKELARTFYNNINLNVDDILERSDLYEKEGKNPHAFCTHIDRAGDVRILTNLQNDEKWMETMLHELGHGVYDKYIDASLPYLLREPAHIFTTEAIAMFFGRLSRNANWIQDMTGISNEEKFQIAAPVYKSLRLQQWIFARWCQVMFRFEQELYKNPDQDLNQLWWDLVETYQLIKKPKHRDNPDWAAKIHFTSSPVYYHNYMLGELLASQLFFYILENVLKADSGADVSYVNKVEIGNYLKDKIFAVGASYYWNDMIKKATGEPLAPKYFVQQFVQ